MGKTKPQTAKGDDASNLVLTYLRKQNRPYSATDITSNLHNAVTKAGAQKILQQLVEGGAVSCKTQGKQSIYVIRQNDGDVPTESELAEMDRTIESLKAQISALKEENKQLSATYTSLATSLPTSEIQARIDELDKEIFELVALLEPLKSGTLVVSTAAEREQADKDLARVKKIYHHRRAIFQNMAGTLKEGLGKQAYDDLKDKLGIDDESEEFLAMLKNEPR